MERSSAKPTSLTRNGIKTICETENVAEDLSNKEMTFQVVSAEIFDGNQQRKNIKGRVNISDGISKMIVLLSDKAFQLCEQAGFKFEKYQVITINVGKQKL